MKHNENNNRNATLGGDEEDPTSSLSTIYGYVPALHVGSARSI